MRMVVVLPAPLGPKRPAIWPGLSSNEMPRTALTCPKDLWTPSTRTMGLSPPSKLHAEGTPGPVTHPQLAVHRPIPPPCANSPLHFCRQDTRSLSNSGVQHGMEAGRVAGT